MSGKRRLMFLYNPRAGTGQITGQLSDVLDTFVKAGYEVTVRPTQKYHDAYEQVRSLSDDFDLLICAGGDGTLAEAVSGMVERENRIPIGYIPCGSTNDFALSLRIPMNIQEAADNAVLGEPFQCDLGVFGEASFLYVAAFGLFTDVSYETKQEMKNVFGHMAYLLEGMKRLANIPSYRMRVKYDDHVIEDDFAFGMVTNSRSVGGFRNMVNQKKIVFDDGLFEVTLIRYPKNPIELQAVISALVLQQMDERYVYSFQTEKIMFESRELVAWTLDGEYGGSHNRVRISDNKQAIRLMLPPKSIHRVSEKYIAEPDDDVPYTE